MPTDLSILPHDFEFDAEFTSANSLFCRELPQWHYILSTRREIGNFPDLSSCRRCC
jgi:hypothetical protein